MNIDRAQSTVVGVLLLVAVAVVLAGTVAILALGFGENATQDPISVSLQSEVTDRAVIVRHAAGDPLPVESTVVIVETDDERVRLSPGSLSQTATDGDARFTAGESYRIPHDVSDGELQVSVVEEDRGAVVHEQTYQLSSGTVSKIANFQQKSTSDWSGNANDEDATVSVSDDGRTVAIEGNTWQKIDFAYDVTDDTVIAFEFESDAEGAIHAIGFENDNSQNGNQVLQVFGVQEWGQKVSEPPFDGTYYRTDAGTVQYTVRIGQLYPDGYQADSLLLINDCDGKEAVDCTVPPDSQFRNIQVYESDS